MYKNEKMPTRVFTCRSNQEESNYCSLQAEHLDSAGCSLMARILPDILGIGKKNYSGSSHLLRGCKHPTVAN